MSFKLLIGGNDGKQVFLSAKTANRHGMIAGATGTGKTVSLQILAEGFSDIGVPVFMADVKGDLSGLAQAGTPNDKIQSRLDSIGIESFAVSAKPVLFWDMFGEQGHPVRTTISEMGPLLLSSLLELNDTQTGVLYAAFSIADDQGLLLLDLKDMRSMLNWVGQNRKSLATEYGNLSTASIGAIQRRLLVLEEQGAEYLFGEPALQLQDLMRTELSGNGIISVMDVTRLVSRSPRVYASFLIWLLSELFEELPEVGDRDKPKFVLFFDEAHLLFNRAPRALVDKIEQVVRLIRSKGVGIIFISQSPMDIPEAILGQLGLKIQHALRAFTPKDKKAIRAVSDSFRQNPQLDTRKVITELGTGEALVSVLDDKGAPTPVERILIRPPETRIGPLTADERKQVMQRSPLSGQYDKPVDRESAYELLKRRAATRAQNSESKPKPRSSSRRQSATEAMIKSAARSIGSSLGRQLIRGIMGTLFGGKR